MRRWRFKTNLLPARAGSSKPRVAEDGAAAREVGDVRAIGPHNAIDQFENGTPSAATLLLLITNHGMKAHGGFARTGSGYEPVKSYVAIATDEDWKRQAHSIRPNRELLQVPLADGVRPSRRRR